jgi:hypothetical protein
MCFLIRVTGSYIETETVDLRSIVTDMMLFPVSMDKFLTCYKDSDQILESGTGTGHGIMDPISVPIPDLAFDKLYLLNRVESFQIWTLIFNILRALCCTVRG